MKATTREEHSIAATNLSLNEQTMNSKESEHLLNPDRRWQGWEDAKVEAELAMLSDGKCLVMARRGQCSGKRKVVQCRGRAGKDGDPSSCKFCLVFTKLRDKGAEQGKICNVWKINQTSVLHCTEHINCYTKPSASVKALAHFSAKKFSAESAFLGGGEPSAQHLRNVAKRDLGYDLPYNKKAYRVLDIMAPKRRKRTTKIVRNITKDSNTIEKGGKAGEEEAISSTTLVSDPETPAAGVTCTEASTTAMPGVTVQLVTSAI